MPAPKPIKYEASKRFWRKEHGNGLRAWLLDISEARKEQLAEKRKLAGKDEAAKPNGVVVNGQYVAGPFVYNRAMGRALRRAHGGFKGSTFGSLSQRKLVPPSIATHIAVEVPEVKFDPTIGRKAFTGKTRLRRIPRPFEVRKIDDGKPSDNDVEAASA